MDLMGETVKAMQYAPGSYLEIPPLHDDMALEGTTGFYREQELQTKKKTVSTRGSNHHLLSSPVPRYPIELLDSVDPHGGGIIQQRTGISKVPAFRSFVRRTTVINHHRDHESHIVSPIGRQGKGRKFHFQIEHERNMDED